MNTCVADCILQATCKRCNDWWRSQLHHVLPQLVCKDTWWCHQLCLVQEISREIEGSAIDHLCRGSTEGSIHAQEADGKLITPGWQGEPCFEATIELLMYFLNHAIGLWMVWCGMSRPNAKQVQKILPKFRDELLSSVRNNESRHFRTSNPPRKKCLGTCFSGSIIHCNCFWQMTKPVNYNEEIDVISWRWEWSHNVNMKVLEPWTWYRKTLQEISHVLWDLRPLTMEAWHSPWRDIIFESRPYIWSCN